MDADPEPETNLQALKTNHQFCIFHYFCFHLLTHNLPPGG